MQLQFILYIYGKKKNDQAIVFIDFLVILMPLADVNVYELKTTINSADHMTLYVPFNMFTLHSVSDVHGEERMRWNTLPFREFCHRVPCVCAKLGNEQHEAFDLSNCKQRLHHQLLHFIFSCVHILIFQH